MQNTSQTFRGTAAAPGVNYADHSYDNHIGSHCQSSGYQQYSNQLYHPRPHHYGNHQMQQNMPYRHHGGGAYAPNQNQYGSSINQDLYRNHHPSYAGNNNRNIPSKTWTETNNSSDLMPPYGQVSPHSQMMNNPQMPVTTMRSPPHATSSMNQSASQGQQHFRPMQSPAHSPHSWSQAQIPSPGMMHSSRTSPLPAHVRSPGHSQPFSPPAAHSMNLPPHPTTPQENGQISQSLNSSSDNPANPLHSLQKMVLLDQDSKAMMGLPGDGNEQFQNQCGSHSFVPEDGTAAGDAKNSQYSTYYNMDENRFESKPNSSTSDSSVFASLQPITNCNFPIPSHPVSNETDIKNIARVPGSMNPSVPDAFHSNPNQNSLSHQISNSALEQSQCKSSIPQSDCSLKQNECPPHAESAPLFTDQTKAAVSTNSEQALESKSSSNWLSDASDPEKASVAQVSLADTAGTPHSSMSQDRCTAFEPSLNDSSHENSLKEFVSTVNSDKSSFKDNEDYSLKDIKDFKPETENEKSNQEMQNPSIGTVSSESQDCDSNMTSSDSKSSSSYDDSHGSEKKITNNHEANINYEDIPSLEAENKSNSQPESCNPKASTNDSSSTNPSSSSDQNETESQSPPRNPVKVVIHRIRKSDADDTWHVPGSASKDNETEKKEETEKVPESKSSTAPQIIMLSQAVTEKKYGFRNSHTPNSAANPDDEQDADKEDTNSSVNIKEEPLDSPDKNSNSNTDKNSNSDKKRGRPAGSRNRMKPPSGGKNKRGKKVMKKKKGENSKQKAAEATATSKIKKVVKSFNGPYIHITGNKENPSSISVINVAQKEEEKLSKTQTKRTVSSAVSRIKNKTVGHLSTLSPTYDAYNRDKTWVCIFCQKGSHHGGLGDLYGPYYIKDNSEEKPPSTPGTSAPRNKRKKSETDDSKTPKRAKQSTAQPSSTNRTKNADDAEPSEPMKEVWIHEDCAIWCQSITLLGEEVRGLEEAVTEANENKCSQCALHGATLGCWGKGCKEMYHYTCAKETGCQLDIEKFSLLCIKHQKKSP